MVRGRLILLLLALPVLLAPAVGAWAADAASVQVVRAALVFNFIKFTEWPAASVGDRPFKVCIASDDAVQIAALESLSGRQVRGMPLESVRFRGQTDCGVIYVDSSQRWNDLADKRASGHALTIGGYAGFVADGGMIEISVQEGGARFDVNLLDAKRAGLRFYPQLLRLARRLVD